MINKSTELEAIIRRWVDSVQGVDREAIKNLFSESNALRYIGTDEAELWSGKIVRDAYSDHLAEIPDFSFDISEVEAYERDRVGWGSMFGIFRIAGVLVDSPIRMTFVFVLESGIWRIVQTHFSIPKPNVEVLGVEHKALDELVAAIESGRGNIATEGTSTVMFTDIVDSTVLTNAVGDQAWSETITWHNEVISSCISEQGGILVKSLGDGTMSTFASGRSALFAALSINSHFINSDREPRFDVRIGVHTGDVVQEKNDYIGSVVNKAARIASAAQAREILVSDATRAMVGGSLGFKFSDPKTVKLRGLEGPHTIYQLLEKQ